MCSVIFLYFLWGERVGEVPKLFNSFDSGLVEWHEISNKYLFHKVVFSNFTETKYFKYCGHWRVCPVVNFGPRNQLRCAEARLGDTADRGGQHGCCPAQTTPYCCLGRVRSLFMLVWYSLNGQEINDLNIFKYLYQFLKKYWQEMFQNSQGYEFLNNFYRCRI